MSADHNVRWFSWGDTLAVVADDGRAWSVQAAGWGAVNSADVLSDTDARALSHDQVRRTGLFREFGEPPLAR